MRKWPDWWINLIKNTPKCTETTRWIHDILHVDRIIQISNWWPNNLTPKGLIFNEISGRIFEYLKSKWVKFYLDTERKTELWYSDKNNKYIFLWLRTPRSYTKNMWIADSVDEDIKTQLVFLHEMCHHLAWEIFDSCQSFKELFNLCLSLRRQNPKNGASKLADMNFYQWKWITTQATEDCVELLRIYFMCREDESQCFDSIKHKLHLHDNETCKEIFNLLSESVVYKFPTR